MFIPDLSTGLFIVDFDQTLHVNQRTAAHPGAFKLFPNYPNPFNPETTLPFVLPDRMQIRITVHDITGRRVKTLLQGYQPAGHHHIVWDGTDRSGRKASSGIYFIRIQTKEWNQMQKVVLVK
ncbi:MAG: FlgD immunoglobulin-like domain containing protein [candidate division KSB1 bacterium]|nr:FlgD immunoglobulin-like domain containing protein [candidate division KSB1 bacterium]